MDLLLAFFCVPCAFFMGYRLAFPTKADDGTGPSSFFKSFPIIVSVIIIALSNIYYIAFSLIFLCVIATALALQQRRIRPDFYLHSVYGRDNLHIYHQYYPADKACYRARYEIARQKLYRPNPVWHSYF